MKPKKPLIIVLVVLGLLFVFGLYPKEGRKVDVKNYSKNPDRWITNIQSKLHLKRLNRSRLIESQSQCEKKCNNHLCRHFKEYILKRNKSCSIHIQNVWRGDPEEAKLSIIVEETIKVCANSKKPTANSKPLLEIVYVAKGESKSLGNSKDNCKIRKHSKGYEPLGLPVFEEGGNLTLTCRNCRKNVRVQLQ